MHFLPACMLPCLDVSGVRHSLLKHAGMSCLSAQARATSSMTAPLCTLQVAEQAENAQAQAASCAEHAAELQTQLTHVEAKVLQLQHESHAQQVSNLSGHMKCKLSMKGMVQASPCIQAVYTAQ